MAECILIKRSDLNILIMNLKYILFLAIAGSLSSCQWGKAGKKDPAITKDTLTYSFKNFKEKAPDCGDKPDSACTIVKVSYPEFNGRQALNDSVARKLNMLFGDDKKPGSSLAELSKSFMSGYADFRKDRPKSTLQFLLDAKARILRQDSSLTTVEVTGYSYTGGAHGVSYTSYVNWNTAANKSIALSDILIDGYHAQLTQGAEQIFRKQEKLSDTTKLTNGRTYFFKDDKFSLPDAYVITPLGIKFLYNVYTIKPYAAGPTELLVPYAQIKSLIKPGTVLSQYLK